MWVVGSIMKCITKVSDFEVCFIIQAFALYTSPSGAWPVV
jgi:hypothetical protein